MPGLDDWLPQYDHREYHEHRLSEPRAFEIVFDLCSRAAKGGSILSTETRVAGGSVHFRAYWLVVRPFSGLIRRRWLIAAAKRAAAPAPNSR